MRPRDNGKRITTEIEKAMETTIKPRRLPGAAGEAWRAGLARILAGDPGAAELWDLAWLRLRPQAIAAGTDDAAIVHSLEFLELVEEFAVRHAAGKHGGAKSLLTVRMPSGLRAAIVDEARSRRMSCNEFCCLRLADALIPGEWRPMPWTATSDRLTLTTLLARRHAPFAEPAGAAP